jgi:outer membrane protein, multidrug efflux system
MAGQSRSVIMRVALRALAVLLSTLLAGCITPPNVSPVQKLSPTPTPVHDEWWTAYQDPLLNQLLNAALADNPTLGQTLARVRQARAVVYGTRAALWPYISYDADEVRERVSAHDTIPSQFAGGE